MGVDILCRGGFSTNWPGWRELYALGVRYGWEPAGTDDYFFNNDLVVGDADAKAWSAALYQALEAGVLDEPHAAHVRRFAEVAAGGRFNVY
jgi:hypothetical protein